MKKAIVSTSKDVMGGTRVLIETLIDYLKAGDSIDDFLKGFPTVEREQVVQSLQEPENGLRNTPTKSFL